MTAPINIPSNTCTHPDGCGKPVVNKSLGLCMTHYQAWRRNQQKSGLPTNTKKIAKQVSPMQFVIPPEIIENMSKARTTEDWQTLGEAIAPIMASIMAGNVLANAAQVSLIKDIMNRAYGKPVATQAEKKVSSGVVLLPTLETDKRSMTCPKCAFDAINQLQDDSTRELAVKVLKELLERLIAPIPKAS